MTDPTADRRAIPALRVRQWLREWDRIEWQPEERRSKPPPEFYQFTISAKDLRALSGVRRRTTVRTSAAADLGIQRIHDRRRSEEIGKFVRYGYPWSTLSDRQRQSSDFQDLRQPGWLPTAVIVNILKDAESDADRPVAPHDLLHIEEDGDGALPRILLPKNFGDDWDCTKNPPIEIIDGQHRLWAFDPKEPGHGPSGEDDNFEIPVVAFHGLDRSWQAYLFYTINIKPKRINASLAFDLYPLLRTEEWLEKTDGHRVYRETRAQELVDTLWARAESPWHHRINMLGEPGYGGLQATQSAWIRSLLASFVKRWEATRHPIGGLFGGRMGEQRPVLPWSRSQQSAFLILAGQELRRAILNGAESWANALRTETAADSDDPSFYGKHNLLNQDQGIRVFLQAVNDLFFLKSAELDLLRIPSAVHRLDADDDPISGSLDAFRRQERVMTFLAAVAIRLSAFDWRSSSAPGLGIEDQTLKAQFRGSGGYLRSVSEIPCERVIVRAAAHSRHSGMGERRLVFRPDPAPLLVHGCRGGAENQPVANRRSG